MIDLDSFYTHTIYDNKKIWLTKKDIRAQWIYSQNGTQKEKVSLLKELCLKEEINCLFDIGANYGEFSVGLSDVVAEIYAYEPNIYVYQCLEKTSTIYNNLHTYNIAVDIKESLKDFYIHKLYSGGGRLEQKWIWKDSRYAEQSRDTAMYEKYSIYCADILQTLHQKQLQGNILIKIDIEGKELELVDRMSEFLKNYQYNWFVFFEIPHDQNKVSDLSLNTKLNALEAQILGRYSSDILIGRKAPK